MYLSSVSSRLLLFDTNSWDLKKSYGCYDGLLRDISWSDDGKYMLQVNSKGIIEILSAADHEVRSVQHVPIKDTWSACFHRDGHHNVAIGTRSGNVMIWNTKNKNITKTFPVPSQQCSIDFINFNANNTRLAATMHNGDTVIYSLLSNIPVLTVKLSNSQSISAMKFHHKSSYVLGLATDEGHVVLRDITTNKDRVHFENVHAAPVSDIAYSLVNRDVLLSCGYDKITHVYDVRLQNVVSTLKTPYTLTSMAINIENQVALGTKTGIVLIYDLRDLTNPYKVLKGHAEEVHRVSFQPSCKNLISADISLRDVENLSPKKVTPPIKSRTPDMFFVSDSHIHTSDVSPTEDKKVDSLLVMMGLDNSNEAEDDTNKMSEDRRSDTPAKHTLDVSPTEDNKADSIHVMMGPDNSNKAEDDTNRMSEHRRSDTPAKHFLDMSPTEDNKADSIHVMMGLDNSNEAEDDTNRMSEDRRSDTPAKHTLDVSPTEDNKADSIHVMMGLDNSNEAEDDTNRMSEDRRSDTPAKHTLDVSPTEDNKADSIHVMMGLDNSNEAEDDTNRMSEDRRSDTPAKHTLDVSPTEDNKADSIHVMMGLDNSNEAEDDTNRMSEDRRSDTPAKHTLDVSPTEDNKADSIHVMMVLDNSNEAEDDTNRMSEDRRSDTPAKHTLDVSPTEDNKADSIHVMMGLDNSNEAEDDTNRMSEDRRSDTPAKHTLDMSPTEDNKADSIHVMMGPDNSNEAEDDSNRMSEDRWSDGHEARYHQLDVEKNIIKMSTPLSSMQPNMGDVAEDTKNVEELKDFIKLTMYDVAGEMRSYFLDVMMALTKQKLYLEKQLSHISAQMNVLMDSESALIEANRKLVIELYQLKARQNYQ